MRIQSKPYGPIDIDERQQLYFPKGILGFETFTNWALLDSSQTSFYWMQSLDDSDLAFVLIDPLTFRPDYNPELSVADRQDLGLDSEDAILCFAIVTIPADQNRMSANLQGPIVINRKTHQGKQIIHSNPRYNVRHFIFEELAAGAR